MISLILISIFSVIGLFFSLKNEGLFQKIITIGLSISVFIAWAGNSSILLVSLLIQLIFGVISAIYALKVSGLSLIERISIGITGLLVSVGTLGIINHYPWQLELRLSLIIPILLFIWISIKNIRKLSKEFGFMLIWFALMIFQFLHYLEKLFY